MYVALCKRAILRNTMSPDLMRGRLDQGRGTPVETLLERLKKGPSSYKDIIATMGPDNPENPQSIATAYSKYTLAELLDRPEDTEAWEAMINRSRKVTEFMGEKFKEWRYDLEMERNYMRSKIENSILVDLGSGLLTMEPLAKEYGASGYIAVDKFLVSDVLAYSPTQNRIEHINAIFKTAYDPRRCALIRADMLDFTSRLPSNSANFTLNGLG